jgi:hypothetical protein
MWNNRKELELAYSTLYFATSSLTSLRSPLVKINPTLPYSNNSKLSISQNKNDQLKHNKKRNKRNEI